MKELSGFTLLAIATLCGAAPSLAQPYPNVRVNQVANNPEETSIAINPKDPNNIVGVAQSTDCHYYYTMNGGAGWIESDLLDPRCLGDPAITFDRLGNAYYCYIGNWTHSGIFVNRSTNGGVTWNPLGTAVIEHNGIIPFEDKAYPVCDWTLGQYRNSVYVSWTQFTEYGSPDPADSTWILFSRSSNGAASFFPPLRISDKGGDAVDSDDTVEGAVPAVGPDGRVYVAWSGPRGIEFDRSTDGGMTFGRDTVISDQPGGWDFNVPGIYRCNGLPVTKVDQSYGPYRGRLYVNWSDQRNGDTDVFLIHSDNGGTTWGPCVRVNDDPAGNGAHQFFTWIDVDPVTGTVYAVFYDRRAYPPSSTSTDVYLAISEDGGDHFTNLKISESHFVPNPSAFFGDYSGISAFAGRVRPLWTRMDGTVSSVWTALVDLPTVNVWEETGHAGRIGAFPNPVRSWTRILCRSSAGASVRLTIADICGRRIRDLVGPAEDSDTSVRGGLLWDGRDSAGREVPSGVYLVRGAGLRDGRIVVLR